MAHHQLRCPSRVHAQVIAPVVIGSCMLAAGVLQMLCVVPCCGFKADPLKLEFPFTRLQH